MISISTILGAVLLNFSIAKSQMPVIKDEIPIVTTCQLIESPKKYEYKVVRISAIFQGTFEGQNIYDDTCAKEKNSIEFLPNCKTECDCKKLNEQLYEYIRGNPLDGQYVKIILVGIVEVRDVPPKSNEQNIAIRVLWIEKTSPINN